MPLPEEYYIRAPESETANGPYSVEKLITLAEAGRVSPETLYYDTQQEAWVPISSNEELKQEIFPQKKKLGLRARTQDDFQQLNAQDNGDVVSVDNMLAAAEGDTEETRHYKRRHRWRERAAVISLPMLGMVLTASALSAIYPGWNSIQDILNNEPDAWTSLFFNPILLLGLFDAFLAVCMFLRAADAYPMIRFRGMFGAGFFAVTYGIALMAGEPMAKTMLYSTLGIGFGLFISTMTLDIRVLLLSLGAAAGGAGLFIYYNTLPLFLA